MASHSASLPSTPKLSGDDAMATPSPGTWRHPKLKEIVRRQNASRFGDKNVRRIVWNGGSLIASGLFGTVVKHYLLVLGSLLDTDTYPDVLLFALRLFFIANIAVALYPVYRPKDDLTDIPLTPTQRSLLGLDPHKASPATPGSAYVTPPRYRLSSGSRNASPLGRSTSPLSARGSPQSSSRLEESFSLSPSASPLIHKAVRGGGRDSGRRSSFGSPSPLKRSSLHEGRSFSMSSTPSPTGGRNSGQIFSNKWLYEKSRMHSPDNSIYGR